MARSVEMKFENKLGKKVTVKFPDVWRTTTDKEVKAAMEALVENDIHVGGAFTKKIAANFIEVTEEPIKLN